MAAATVVACLSGVAGLLASHHLETAAGASIALAALCAWGLTLARDMRFRNAIMTADGERKP
jgi:ABC-type Mn2+/Zn2+ transport system permease subunit